MTWIPTTCGAVNSRYVIRIVRDADGSVLHLSNGDKVRSNLSFTVLDGELLPIEPDDDDSDIPF
jgi:hypothetical protein